MKVRGVVVCIALLGLLGVRAAQANEAVVKVSVASVFKSASSHSERVTQVLMGHGVEVHKVQAGWAEVSVTDQYRLADGYPGWILCSELDTHAKPGTALVCGTPSAVVRTTPQAHAAALATVYPASFLTPTGKTQGDWEAVSVPGHAQPGWIRQSDISDKPLSLSTGGAIVKAAETLSGTHYLWGGMSAEGIDCSGLTCVVYKLYGITLPRDADQQFEVGVKVSESDLKPGDLVFYGKDDADITHVGIYKGQGNMVEASSKANAVHVATLHHRPDYRGARRVIGVPLTMPSPSP